MKLSIRGFALAGGIMGIIYMGYIFFIAMTGKGMAAFDLVNQLYLGYLTPTMFGLVIGLVIAFFDCALACALLAWMYNRCAKSGS